MKLIMTTKLKTNPVVLFLKWIVVNYDHISLSNCLLCSLLDYLSEKFSLQSESGAVHLLPTRPARAATFPCKTEVKRTFLFGTIFFIFFIIISIGNNVFFHFVCIVS